MQTDATEESKHGSKQILDTLLYQYHENITSNDSKCWSISSSIDLLYPSKQTCENSLSLKDVQNNNIKASTISFHNSKIR